jgi:hypothetical protein
MTNIKEWPIIQQDVADLLKAGWKRTIYHGTGKYKNFIPEVAFIKKEGRGLRGCSYQSCQCTQALLRRIAKFKP